MRSPVIAIVNDDVDTVRILDAILRQAGYRTIRHQQGAGVLGLIVQTQAVLLILDISMEHPDSGWLVLDELRQNPATQQLPVLIYSAVPHVAQRAQARGDAFCAVLPVGADVKALLTMVQQWLPDQRSSTHERADGASAGSAA